MVGKVRTGKGGRQICILRRGGKGRAENTNGGGEREGGAD